jgi:hypothetical protein
MAQQHLGDFNVAFRQSNAWHVAPIGLPINREDEEVDE